MQWVLLIALLTLGMLTCESIQNVKKIKNENRSLEFELSNLKVEHDRVLREFVELGKIPAYQISVDFLVKNTAVIGSIKNGNIDPFIQSFMTVTRDSLYNKLKKGNELWEKNKTNYTL